MANYYHQSTNELFIEYNETIWDTELSEILKTNKKEWKYIEPLRFQYGDDNKNITIEYINVNEKFNLSYDKYGYLTPCIRVYLSTQNRKTDIYTPKGEGHKQLIKFFDELMIKHDVAHIDYHKRPYKISDFIKTIKN